MLRGFDMYHGNSDVLFRQHLSYHNDFIILKASEGKTFVDKKFRERADAVLNAGVFLGAYHFARPENGNSVDDELNNFKNVVGQFKVRPFLDIEDKAIYYPEWCEEWLRKAKEIWSNVGYYCSLSPAKKQLNNLAGKYPLWVAHYNDDDKDGCRHIDGEIITQYQGKTVDLDVAIDMNYDTWYGNKLSMDEPITMVVTEKERKIIEFLRSLE